MERLVIAIDCDDVLVPTTKFFVDAYNKEYGTNAALAHSHGATSSSSDVWGADEEEVIRRWGLLTETDEYKALGPDPVEAAILRRLAECHELHLVTARKEDEREFTQEMLSRELKGVFTAMEFVGWQGSKGQVCQQLKADVLIDDSLRNLMSAHECKVRSLLWFGEYEWQAPASTAPEGITQCANWPEVEAEIERLASR